MIDNYLPALFSCFVIFTIIIIQLQRLSQPNTSADRQSVEAHGDIVYTPTQLQFIAEQLQTRKDGVKRHKRKISNFETFPANIWDMPIKYKISSEFSGKQQ